MAIVVPLAFATASIGGVASADDSHDKNDAVTVFCNNPFNFSLVDAGGGNGGLLGQVAKGLGVGLGGDGYHGGVSTLPYGDNTGGDGVGLGAANFGSADGGDGGNAEQSTHQYVANNRCTVGDETHKKKVQVIKDSFNKIDKKKIVRSGH
ncbi:hypothetical protein LRD69_15285 [Streptomyces sp. JH14]|uniref:hypothetical protein n=1 Tax=Streptomyces sp. JH14 TaxID=2793630 RepID=UPI0023F7D1E6|nr:hypothetical protein [Streptomyces sp. JH14]MDF6043469.1 hypothetical protein [Streptomyces sp. JH14]